MLDIYRLFQAGQAKLQEEFAAREMTKVGTLRAGNTGMVTPEGVIIGPCMGATYLRYSGIDLKGLEDDGDSGGAPGRELMFEAGRGNEDLWYAVLSKSHKGKILREEEIPTKWKTAHGVDVTGRPDIVLCDEEGKPQTGIELKLVCSFWTAYEVMIQGKPKYSHLLQAAHYAWQLGIPFELWYTNRVDYHMQSWVASQFPPPGDARSFAITYTYSEPKVGGGKRKITKEEYVAHPGPKNSEPLKIGPFVIGYQIKLVDGVLQFRAANKPDGKWQISNIKIADIQRYYECIPDLTEVPPEPKVLKADGTRANYKASDYCQLGKLCCKYTEGTNIIDWKAQVSQAVSEK